MPALQVRDFPDDLYARLKIFSASQYRSIAQQTIVAVEQMLDNAQEEGRLEKKVRVDSFEQQSFDGEDERHERAKTREKLFAELDSIAWGGAPASTEDIVNLVRNMRDDRAEHLCGSEVSAAQGSSEGKIQ